MDLPFGGHHAPPATSTVVALKVTCVLPLTWWHFVAQAPEPGEQPASPPSLCPDRERVPHRGAAWDPPSGANSCSPWESLIAPHCTSPPRRAAALYHAGVQTRRRVGLRAGTSPRLSPVRPARPGSQRALGLAYTAPHANPVRARPPSSSAEEGARPGTWRLCRGRQISLPPAGRESPRPPGHSQPQN